MHERDTLPAYAIMFFCASFRGFRRLQLGALTGYQTPYPASPPAQTQPRAVRIHSRARLRLLLDQSDGLVSVSTPGCQGSRL